MFTSHVACLFHDEPASVHTKMLTAHLIGHVCEMLMTIPLCKRCDDALCDDKHRACFEVDCWCHCSSAVT